MVDRANGQDSRWNGQFWYCFGGILLLVRAMTVAKVETLRYLLEHALFAKLLLRFLTLVRLVFILELALRPLVPRPA